MQMILPNIGSSTDEVVITLLSWCQTIANRFIHEAKSDAVILKTQPFIGPLKPIFLGGWVGGGEGLSKPSNTNLSLCALALLLMMIFPGSSIYMYNQLVIQSFSLKSKC